MDISTAFLIFGILVSLNQSVLTFNCELGWTHFDYHCYRLMSNAKQFKEAEQSCIKMNATLASINNDEETNFMRKNLLTGSTSYNWFGLKKKGTCNEGKSTTRGGWIWTNIVPYEWQNWRENNQYNEPENGECVASMGGTTGKWYGSSSSDKYPFVCEMAGIDSVCLAGWDLLGDTCYIVQFNEKTVLDANRSCVLMSASLASVETLDKNKFVLNLIPRKNRFGQFWIGLKKHETCVDGVSTTRADWTWLDKTQYVWQNWREDSGYYEPDNGDCYASIGGSTGKWYGRKSTERYPYICKRPAYGPSTHQMIMFTDGRSEPSFPTTPESSNTDTSDNTRKSTEPQTLFLSHRTTYNTHDSENHDATSLPPSSGYDSRHTTVVISTIMAFTSTDQGQIIGISVGVGCFILLALGVIVLITVKRRRLSKSTRQVMLKEKYRTANTHNTSGDNPVYFEEQINETDQGVTRNCHCLIMSDRSPQSDQHVYENSECCSDSIHAYESLRGPSLPNKRETTVLHEDHDEEETTVIDNIVYDVGQTPEGSSGVSEIFNGNLYAIPNKGNITFGLKSDIDNNDEETTIMDNTLYEAAP